MSDLKNCGVHDACTSELQDPAATLTQLLEERWTCRQFLQDQVPHETIERLLAIGQRTPSWCNTQPWQVAVTSGEATDRFREKLIEHVMSQPAAPDFDFPVAYPGHYRERRRECGYQLYDSVGVTKGDAEGTLRQGLRNFELFDAPHVAIITTEAELGVYGAIDCGLYVNTLLLGAQSLGLAAAPQAALASYSPFLREHFGIPDSRRVVIGISFGYADLDHPINRFRTTRAELAETVAWHTR